MTAIGSQIADRLRQFADVLHPAPVPPALDRLETPAPVLPTPPRPEPAVSFEWREQLARREKGRNRLVMLLEGRAKAHDLDAQHLQQASGEQPRSLQRNLTADEHRAVACELRNIAEDMRAY